MGMDRAANVASPTGESKQSQFDRIEVKTPTKTRARKIMAIALPQPYCFRFKATPQCGQESASLLTSFLHSLHAMIAMANFLW